MIRKSAGSAGNGVVRSSLPQLSRNSEGKRCGSVEDLIAWAWREELPKAPKQSGPRQMASGWMQTERFAEYLSLVDLHGINEYGAVPDFSADSWPCRDAQMIGRAVLELDDYALELPEDWRPAPELDSFGGLGAKTVSDAWRRMTVDHGGGQKLRLRPSEIVVHRAVMGYDPGSMAIEGVEQRYETAANGKERWFVVKQMDVIVGRDGDGNDITRLENVEVNGWSQRLHRALPGAYRKPYLDPDPVDAVIARAEHEIWLSALGMVFDQVAREMTDVVMLPSRVDPQPWRDDAREPRILPDLVAQAAMDRAERLKVDAAFERRFPRWFRALRRASEKIQDGAA